MDLIALALAKNYTDKQIEKAEMGDIELDKTLTKEGFAADAKAVGEALKNIDIPEASEQVQANWEQMDESAPDYIKNKTHYDSLVNITIAEPQTVTYGYDEMDGSIWELFGIPELDCVSGYEITLGDKIVIIADDVEHVGVIAIGEGQKWDDEQGGFVNYSYYCADCGDYIAEFNQSTVSVKCNKPLPDSGYEEFSVTISILKSSGEIKKLDNKFIDIAGSIDESDERPISSKAVAEARTHYEDIEIIEFVPDNILQLDVGDGQYMIATLTNPIGIPKVGTEIECFIELNYYQDRYNIDTKTNVLDGNYCIINTKYNSTYRIDFYENSLEIKLFVSPMNFDYESITANASLTITNETVKKLDPKFIDASSFFSDWKQNDPDGIGYVKNRTHWSSSTTVEFIPLQEIRFSAFDGQWSGQAFPNTLGVIPKVGDKLAILIDEDWNYYESEVKEFYQVIEIPDEGWSETIRYNYIECGGYRAKFEDEQIILTPTGSAPWGEYVYSQNVGLVAYDGYVKKLDNKFIDTANTVDINDNRPITSAAVQVALDNFNGTSTTNQSDWNQNDTEAMDYIKNRPCYEYEVETLIVDNQTATFDGENVLWTANLTKVEGAPSVQANQKIRVVVDGNSYYATTQMGGSSIKAEIGELGPSGYVLYFKADDYVELYAPDENSITITISIYLITTETSKLDNKFIDSAEELNIEDNRPIQNAAVAVAVANLHEKIDGAANSSQSDWSELDETQSAFIKNKPFGLVPEENYLNKTLTWKEEYDSDARTEVYTWTGVTRFQYCPFVEEGDYLVRFNGQEAIVHLNYRSGTIKTDFIEIEYSYTNYWETVFEIVSEPPRDSSLSSQLVIIRVGIKKIDNLYIDPVQSDWNETDETSASYIQNRTHWDEGFGEWEELARVQGEQYYDEMDGWRYSSFAEAEVNVHIQFGYEYSILLYDANDDMGENPGYKPDNGDKVRTHENYGDDGMDYNAAITYNGVEYVSAIGTITLPRATSGLAIYRHEILSPMKQLDEKFIPDTIARAIVASEDALGGVKPVTKTDDMTQPVGVGVDGRLWVSPASASGNSGGEVWRKIAEVETTEELSAVDITTDLDGNAFNLKKLLVIGYVTPVSEIDNSYAIKLCTDKTIVNVWSQCSTYFGYTPKATETASHMLATRELIVGAGFTISNLQISPNKGSLINTLNYPYGASPATAVNAMDKGVMTNDCVIDRCYLGSYQTCIGIGSKFTVYGVDL